MARSDTSRPLVAEIAAWRSAGLELEIRPMWWAGFS